MFQDRYPKGKLSKFPTENFEEILSCNCCKNVPNPNDYMVCEDNGHMICGECAIKIKAQVDGEEIPNSTPLPCCTKKFLRKGRPTLLAAILDRSTWRCENSKDGCPAIFYGKERRDHVGACSYYGSWRCYFHNCKIVCASLNELLVHYLKSHQACSLKGEGNKFLLEVDPKMFENGEGNRRILGFLEYKECTFLFACEFNDKSVHAWVWNLDHELVHAIDEVYFSIGLFSRKAGKAYNGPSFKNGRTFPYNKISPEDLVKKRIRHADDPEDVDHFILRFQELKKYIKNESDKSCVFLVTLNS